VQEARPPVLRAQLEAVAAVEEAGDEELAEPLEDAPVADRDAWAEGPAAAEADLQDLARHRGALEGGEEWIPVSVGGKVGEDAPDLLGGPVDEDLGADRGGRHGTLLSKL